MGKVIAVCTSGRRGIQKKDVCSGHFDVDWGIEGDAHAGKWHRQVSLLSADKIAAFNEKGAGVVLRFVVNISVCWLLAYGLAKPAVAWVLSGWGLSEQLQGNLTMLAGSGLFVILNYFGQRFFAFKQR